MSLQPPNDRPLSSPALRARTVLALTVLVAGGCAQTSPALQSQLNQYQTQQIAMTRQFEQLQQRATSLDQQNRELQTSIAQSQQQAKVTDDQLVALREQLRSVNAQLVQSRTERASAQQKVETLTASMRRQAGVTITPNNSVLQTLPALDLPPGYVRRDGDCIRVTLPASQLFDAGAAQLRPAAAGMILQAATELIRLYPDQIIGVEGYTDSDPVVGGPWRNNHELSVARAVAVYQLLTTRTQLRAEQLFVVGHGSNQPIASNATPEGKETNRRVELVVYPERKS